jgi:hypothetical protein
MLTLGIETDDDVEVTFPIAGSLSLPPMPPDPPDIAVVIPPPEGGGWAWHSDYGWGYFPMRRGRRVP